MIKKKRENVSQCPSQAELIADSKQKETKKTITTSLRSADKSVAILILRQPDECRLYYNNATNATL